MNNPRALIPEYMQSFQCIGSQCEDTCCAGWRITIDKPAFDKYKTLRKTELRKKLQQNMELINEKERNSVIYAQLTMNPATGSCSMLAEDGLCSIQKEMGEHYLSNTCASYPRIVNNVENFQEISAVVSCPEIARLALLNPKGIEFIEIDSIENRNTHVVNKLNPSKVDATQFSFYFWDLRVFTIEILQNREFSFSHRMIIMGVFYERLQEIVDQGQTNEIPNFIQLFKEWIRTDAELRNYSLYPENSEFQLKLLNSIWMEQLEKGIPSLRLRESVDSYLRGMMQVDQTNMLLLLDHFNQAYKQYYFPYMEQHEYIWENYAVNYVYKNLFPLSKDKSMFHEYMILVIHYASMKLQLIGMSADQKGLTEELVIKLIQSYSKVYEHSNTFAKKVYEALVKDGYTTMGHMSLLIKNGSNEI